MEKDHEASRKTQQQRYHETKETGGTGGTKNQAPASGG